MVLKQGPTPWHAVKGVTGSALNVETRQGKVTLGRLRCQWMDLSYYSDFHAASYYNFTIVTTACLLAD